ncbi:Hypothetical predicted protein [Mytilus galloprovincialis]|uniref:Uncharacterized protein n=1 Tax=Mytilus galloprovincialis TaxID=29158 RepID=A0A8B6GF95_MYTGA|nr:Hypothetical predicted protein [Mytilus galloprovincialis]
MQGLALADGLTALCSYGFEPFFSMQYEQIGNLTLDSHWIVSDEIKSIVGLKFPFCLIHYCLTNLADTFHLVSILITASLGIQKLLAVNSQEVMSAPLYSVLIDPNLEMDNIALHKTNIEWSQRLTECLNNIPNLNISDETCISDFDELPSQYEDNVTREVEALTLELEPRIHRFLSYEYKRVLKPNYYDIIDVLHDGHSKEIRKYAKQTLFDIVAKIYCNATEKYLNKIIRHLFVDIMIDCLFTNADTDLSFFILGSSPYSEPMNYIMNITWGRIDITLEQLKLFIEILKLLMIFGCASNFMIYIVMSEKLREALKNDFQMHNKSARTTRYYSDATKRINIL